MIDKCMLCGDEALMTRHHLVPTGIAATCFVSTSGLIYICKPCHNQVHKRFTDDELKDKYNDLISLGNELANRLGGKREKKIRNRIKMFIG